MLLLLLVVSDHAFMRRITHYSTDNARQLSGRLRHTLSLVVRCGASTLHAAVAAISAISLEINLPIFFDIVVVFILLFIFFRIFCFYSLSEVGP